MNYVYTMGIELCLQNSIFSLHYKKKNHHYVRGFVKRIEFSEREMLRILEIWNT